MNRIERDRVEQVPGAGRCVGPRVGMHVALVGALASSVLTAGCAVVTVAGAAASVAATAASTVVDVGVGAVRVTGKVIGNGVDLVTGPSASSTPVRN